VKNQGRESDVIQKLFAIHNREIDEVRKGIKDFGVELEEVTEVVRKVISDFKRRDQ
jgi:phage-related minor tail protein